MVKINMSNRQRKIPLNFEARQLIEKAVEAAIKSEDFTASAEVNVTVVSDAKIKIINKEFRNVDSATDVLSFPLCDGENFDINPENGCCMLGDVVISIDHVLKQAEAFGHGIERELAYLTVHSVLHLLGYDHVDEGEEKKLMRIREEAALSLLGLEIK